MPTFEEAGIKGLVLDQWVGAFVPAGTPPAIIARLRTEMSKARADPAIREGFSKSAQEAVTGTPEQFTRFVREEYERYERLVAQLKLKPN